MFTVIRKSRNLSLPIDLQLHLFDTMITPVLLYGSEVWRYESSVLLDRYKLQYCKRILGLKNLPIIVWFMVSVSIKNRILNYWWKLVNSNKGRICNIVYTTAFSHYSKHDSVLPWLTFVHSTLDSLGMSYVWNDQVVESPSIFKNKIKTLLKDQVVQNWDSSVNNSPKCLKY